MTLKYSVNDLVATFNNVIAEMTFKQLSIRKSYLEASTSLINHLPVLIPQRQCDLNTQKFLLGPRRICSTSLVLATTQSMGQDYYYMLKHLPCLRSLSRPNESRDIRWACMKTMLHPIPFSIRLDSACN